MIDDTVFAQAEELLQACRERHIRIVTAESCTGGLVAATLTTVPGSSDVMDRGFITYSDISKTAVLGVPPGLIASAGAVSEPVARRMAEAALARSAADLAVAVTGIAGPGGGSEEKPVGLVWFGLASRRRATASVRYMFPGDRIAVRRAAVAQALLLLRAAAAAS